MYPKDVWTVKGIIAGGTDASVFAERIFKYWGVRPLDVYGMSEVSAVASQTLDRTAMTPRPDIVFFEFIPLQEHLRARENPDDQPKTVLYDEVQPGECYEIVFTSLKLLPSHDIGSGTWSRATALRNETSGVNLPQFVVDGRCDDLIDLGGFTRLTERSIWYAIEKSGIDYEEWICEKQFENEDPILRIWLEPKNGTQSAEEARVRIHNALS